MRDEEMTSVLFIWVLTAGQMQLAASETFYTLEACQSAARAVENAHFLFQGDKPIDSEVRAICSPKRLGKQEK
ncbi:hypothetical protein STP03_048 [Salmonella phage STP03]|uniref:Uncharacterized protein n=1 Tax=Salmonella phage STP03 TaxID=1914788 RepID=A0A1U9HWS7_9CAUD|nr:hypothetical protein QA065_gp46 [Salmonella phage STP03]APM00302.1 hypothetical protein STP03_048 [Salmonella phage STP03]